MIKCSLTPDLSDLKGWELNKWAYCLPAEAMRKKMKRCWRRELKFSYVQGPTREQMCGRRLAGPVAP